MAGYDGTPIFFKAAFGTSFNEIRSKRKKTLEKNAKNGKNRAIWGNFGCQGAMRPNGGFRLNKGLVISDSEMLIIYIITVFFKFFPRKHI